MIVDVHVHVWPDRIAPKVGAHLSSIPGNQLFAPGTVDGLIDHMRHSGVDKAVLLGVAERAETVRRTNDWLMSLQDPRLVAMGSVHPDFPEPAAEIERLRRGGIKGIKVHSLFQGNAPDDKRMFPVYEAMGDDMIALFHVGAGLTTPPEQALATPERLARVLKEFPKLRAIAAHFGGFLMLEEAQEHLIGRDLFLDTSWTPSVAGLAPEQVAAIIRRHDVERVLFGTDSPLVDQRSEIAAVRRLPLNDREMELVLGGNASRLFKLC